MTLRNNPRQMRAIGALAAQTLDDSGTEITDAAERLGISAADLQDRLDGRSVFRDGELHALRELTGRPVRFLVGRRCDA